MGNFIDLTGSRFGRLLVVSRAENKSGHTAWNCLCDCGQEGSFLGLNLKRGKSQSCGCMRTEMIVERSLKHGNRRKEHTTPEYETWWSMIGRCEHEGNTSYHNYGSRGIKVCERWRNSFENFLSDMGKRPTDKHTLDRINNNGDYEPDNFRWATMVEQIRNRRLLKTNKTGVNGVYLNKAGRYHVQIVVNRKKKHIGLFDTLEEAKQARQQAERQYWTS